MVNSFWKPAKGRLWKPVKVKAKPTNSLKVKPFMFKPLRIKQSPGKMNWFKDTDRDGVINLFDCKPFNRRKQGWQHQGHRFPRERTTHIRMMTPEKFLRTTYREIANREKVRLDREGKPIGQTYEKSLSSYREYTKPYGSWRNQENIERLKKVIRSSKGKMEVPFLEYDEQGRPIGHEGRHRAQAAEELGVKLMPVTIARRLKESRDWKHIREGRITSEGKVYKGMAHKKQKKDYRYDLENEKEVTSSKSADIPIQEQREYGEEKPQALQNLDDGSDAEEIVVKSENGNGSNGNGNGEED